MTGAPDLPLSGLSRRRLLQAIPAAALTLPLAGCGLLGGSEGDSGSGDSPSGGGPEKKKLRVGLLPIVDAAAVVLANQEGHFKQEGLEIELVIAQGGARTIPQLISGELDVVFGNWPTVFEAQSKGIAEFVIAGPGYQAAPETFLIMSLPGSGVREPKDLEGKTVALNTRNNIAELTARSSMRNAGVDDSKVTFTEIGFPNAAAALQAKRIDASFLPEPFITSLKDELNGQSVLDVATGPTAGILLDGYVMTKKFADESPNTYAAFSRAIGKAQNTLASDRAALERIVPTYAKIDEKTARNMKVGKWPTTVDRNGLQKVSDLMTELKFLDKPFDVGPLLRKNAP